MLDLKQTIAKNLAALRQNAGMTQSELAEKLNYSDKAISKWERGESIPDVIVLKSIADLFGVKLDDLLSQEQPAKPAVVAETAPAHHRNRKVVTTLSVLLVWFVATVCYVVMDMAIPASVFRWFPFLWAVPVSVVVWLVFNSIWFNQRTNYIIISILMWTGIACIVLTVAACGFWPWKLFYLGITGQLAIYLWSRFQKKKG